MSGGTNGIPKTLENKLLKAKDWYDRRESLEEAIRQYGGISERNQEDRDRFDREAAELLADIVEIIDEAWGFGLAGGKL